ncbi:hypothetical protein [Nocardia donostiensis]|uniref:hypothetical protein n=1 Tax=Nocardia donostiensis TaxID=1538463 RepID=UPI001115553A|nr:hypothetical protein [Nocardia donostiensis]
MKGFIRVFVGLCRGYSSPLAVVVSSVWVQYGFLGNSIGSPENDISTWSWEFGHLGHVRFPRINVAGVEGLVGWAE